MRSAAVFLASLALIAPCLDAQIPGALEQQPLRVHQTILPIFPRSMLDLNVNSGDVRVVLDVAADGALREWLIVGYTHRDFADSVVHAVQRWQFEPMLIDGEGVSAQIELDFNFKTRGVVVSSVGPGTMLAGHFRWLSGGAAYWPRSLRDLDRIPIPLVANAPEYPSELAQQGVVGEATVEFYIDERGAVRMPAVIDADFRELGALSVMAVENWRFEPATARGEPVLVKARQVFHFRPDGRLGD